MKNITLFAALLVLLAGCNTTPEQSCFSQDGIHTLKFTRANGLSIPVNLHVSRGTYYINNAGDEVKLTPFYLAGDTIALKTEAFNTFLYLDTVTFKGYFLNHSKPTSYTLPIEVIACDTHHVVGPTIERKYQLSFSNTNFPYPGILEIYQQSEEYIRGTILTETGDYRYLEGKPSSDSTFFLSTFDGAHLFYFNFTLSGDSLSGKFFSGDEYSTDVLGVVNPDYRLPDPFSLTQVIDPEQPFLFSFPNKEGKIVTNEDYKDTPLLIQIQGSWCPNCMDETVYLSEIYEQYNPMGLDIVALSFEHDTTPKWAFERIDDVIDKTKAPYTFLLAGKSNKKMASEKLNNITEIISFPTCLYLNSDHTIEAIHTGFYGPGTKGNYTSFKKKSKSIIEKIIAPNS